MIRAILIVFGTAFIIGLAYAVIAWALCRKTTSLRTLILITTGLVILHHGLAGLANFYAEPILAAYALYRTVVVYTVIVPWCYGFGYGDTAYWLVLGIQTLVAVLLGACFCTVLTWKRRKMRREQPLSPP